MLIKTLKYPLFKLKLIFKINNLLIFKHFHDFCINLSYKPHTNIFTFFVPIYQINKPKGAFFYPYTKFIVTLKKYTHKSENTHHNPFYTNNNFLKVSVLIKTTTQTLLLRE